jgi:lipopolysaccharide biosynthesis regulator YciM
MPEVIGEIQQCYNRLGHGNSWEDYLNGLVERHRYLKFLQKNQMQQQLNKLAVQQLRYRCDECGFSSRKLFWQCPGCQRWSSVNPIHHERSTSEGSLRDAL